MDDPTVATPSERLRAWRRALGWTQTEAAARLGLKRRVLQYYESGMRDGQPVEIPLTVRLACWALSHGATDWDGRGSRSAEED